MNTTRNLIAQGEYTNDDGHTTGWRVWSDGTFERASTDAAGERMYLIVNRRHELMDIVQAVLFSLIPGTDKHHGVTQSK